PGTDVAEDIRRMWAEHRATYRAAADVIYRTDEKSIPEEVRELEMLIRDDRRFAPLREHFL
ncbi:MAG: hypothetical protein MI724_11825, partial [Spirochaetales bacterium]|nr:hypothetical protein [Spirochaetales bacterium]